MSYNRGKKVNKKNKQMSTLTSKPYNFNGYEVITQISQDLLGVWSHGFFDKDGTPIGIMEIKYEDGSLHTRSESDIEGFFKDVDINLLQEKGMVNTMLSNKKWYEMNPYQYGILKAMQLKNIFA